MLNKMINPDLSGKKQILILGLLLIAVCVFTQTPEWHWATSAGGSDTDAGNSIALDDAGNKYITGCFKGTVSFGSYTLTSEITSYDFFVAKMDADGNWLWAIAADTSLYGTGQGIVLDVAGNIYVTGHFRGVTSFGSHTLSTINNSIDVFVAKIDAHGNWLWATGTDNNSFSAEGRSIAVDMVGNTYVTGYFNEVVSFGSYTLTSNGSEDIFVAKTDANGNWLWAEGVGSSDPDAGHSIAVDAAGSAYVTGWFCETVSFGPHTLTAVDNSRDIFVAKVSDPVNVEESELPVSHNYQLTNYPNPFTGETTISFSLTTNLHEKARIEIYNIRGQRVDEIAIGKEQTSVNWQRTNQANGVYFYKLVVDGNPVDTKKMILLK
jgi:hypothetical protein